MKLITKEILKNMELHDVERDNSLKVIKVIGGWIYVLPRLDQGVMNSVFVPESEE